MNEFANRNQNQMEKKEIEITKYNKDLLNIELRSITKCNRNDFQQR